MRAGEAVAVLGGNPVRLLKWPLIRLLLVGGLVLLILLLGGEDLVVLAVVVGALWVYLLVSSAGDLMGAYANVGMFRASVRAVRADLLRPDWVARDESCDGIVAVDESRRLVLVNGQVFPFERVGAVSQVGPRLDVAVVGDGVRSVSFDDAPAAGDAASRLMASLGIVPDLGA